jgi:hypothetical protein
VDQITADKAFKILNNRKLIVCNEVAATEPHATKKANWDVMKSRITDDTIQVRAMYCDFGENLRNVCNYIFCTNHLESIHMEARDRRYFALQVSSDHAQDTEYFRRLVATYTPAFYSHLLTYLLNMSTSGLNIHIPPMTELKNEMTEACMSLPEQFIRQRREWQLNKALTKPDDMWIQFQAVWSRYIAWLDDQGIYAGKYGGTTTSFYGKVRNLVEKKKSGTMYYRPNARLIAIWQRERDADPSYQELQERKAKRDAEKKPE